jgi:hypothetical protein
VNTFPQPSSANPVRELMQFQIALKRVDIDVQSITADRDDTVALVATLTDATTDSPLANRTLTFSLEGQEVGAANTDANGKATLPNVSLAGLDSGDFEHGITAKFAGDAAYLAGAGSGELELKHGDRGHGDDRKDDHHSQSWR